MNLYFFISTSVSIIFTDILIWDSFLLIDAMYYHKKSDFFSRTSAFLSGYPYV